MLFNALSTNPPRTYGMTIKPYAAILAVCLICTVGCSRDPAAQRQPFRPAVSPRETITKLIEARGGARYQEMRPLILPERTAEVIATLVAVDGFLHANQRLCDLVRRQVGPGLAEIIDQGHCAYYLDIFSQHVELLDETMEDTSADVSFSVDGRVPADHARLRLVERTWRYDPGPGDYVQLADAFDRMAYGLRQTCEELESGRLSPQTLRDKPEVLVEDVRVRLLPGAKLLPIAPTDDGGGK